LEVFTIDILLYYAVAEEELVRVISTAPERYFRNGTENLTGSAVSANNGSNSDVGGELRSDPGLGLWSCSSPELGELASDLEDILFLVIWA
jgi:hypothetical protein